MKKHLKLLSLVLTILAVCVFIPLLATPVSADTGAGTPAVTGVKMPIAGDLSTDAAYTVATVPSGLHYTIVEVKWFNDEGNSIPDDKFVYGTTYRCRVILKPDSGYVVRAGWEQLATINGGSLTKYKSFTDGTIGLYREFTCSTYGVASIDFTGITEPVRNAKPVSNEPRYPDSARGFSVGKISWVCKTNSSWDYTKDLFTAGNKYTCEFLITLWSGYEYSASFSATINGKKATVSTVADRPTALIISYTFTLPSTTKYSSLSISGITAPVTGEKIDLSIPKAYPNYVTVDKVKWYNISDSKYLNDGDVFEANKVYKCQIYFYDDDPTHEFAGSKDTVMINGNKVSSFYYIGDYASLICAEYVFPATKTEKSSITISGVTAPVAGQKPDMEVTVGDWCTVENLSWTEVGSNHTMSATDVFAAGRSYKLSLKLVMTADSTYQFVDAASTKVVFTARTVALGKLGTAENVTYYANGSYDNVSKTEKYCYITYFCDGTKLTNVGVTGLDTPTAGKAIDTSVSLSGSANAEVLALQWNDLTAKQYDLASGTKFVEGHEYYLIVYLKPKAGYYFERKSESDATYTGSVTLNGSPLSNYSTSAAPYVFTGDSDREYNNCLIVGLSFKVGSANTKISSVAISGIDTPVTGGVPDLTCTVSTAGVTVESVSWYEPHYSFEGGKVYTVSVYLKPNTGYQFAESVSATINGKSATFTVDSYGNYIVSYAFPATEVVKPPKATILSQPKGGTFTIGDAVSLVVSAKLTDGYNLSFQWYMTTVNDISTIKAIYDDSDDSYGTQAIFIPEQKVGTVYYCVMVTNTIMQNGKLVTSDPVYSDLVAVTFKAPAEVGYPSVITSPASVSAKLGETVKLSTYIKPIGEGELHIQWYRSTKSDMSGETAVSGATGVELTAEQVEGTVYYRAAAYMEYNGKRSDTVYTKIAAVTLEKADPTVVGIEIQSKPNKLEYNKGESLDTTGMTVRVVMSDGYKNITSGFTCSPTVLNTTGTQVITVTHEGKTATFSVTVKETHTHTAGSEWLSDSESHWHVCSCGHKMSISAHTFGVWKTTKEATETTTGEKERTCSACGYKETAVIPVLAHTHSAGAEWQSNSSGHWKVCSCGEKMNAAAHTFGEWKVTKAATETATGEKERTCSVCGYKETSVIAVIGHVHEAGSGAWNCDAANHWNVCTCGEKINTAAHTFGEWKTVTEATETAAGEKERTCSVCNYKESEVIAALGEGTSTPVVTDKPGETGGTDKPDDTGKTGDDTNGFPWWIPVVAVAGAAVVAVVVVIVVKNKKPKTPVKH